MEQGDWFNGYLVNNMAFKHNIGAAAIMSHNWSSKGKSLESHTVERRFSCSEQHPELRKEFMRYFPIYVLVPNVLQYQLFSRLRIFWDSARGEVLLK